LHKTKRILLIIVLKTQIYVAKKCSFDIISIILQVNVKLYFHGFVIFVSFMTVFVVFLTLKTGST
jgi:hypothetical protein